MQYHQEFERNVKGTKITVADDPETLRAMKNAEISSQIKYHDHASRQMEMEKQRALVDTGNNEGNVPPSSEKTKQLRFFISELFSSLSSQYTALCLSLAVLIYDHALTSSQSNHEKSFLGNFGKK